MASRVAARLALSLAGMPGVAASVHARVLTSGWQWLRLAVMLGCWGLFGFVWLAGAVYNAYRAPAVRLRGGWIGPWVVGFAIVVVALLFVPSGLWARLTFNAPWLWLLGAACLILSTAFTLWARGVLGTMWSSMAVAKEGHQLRTSGPYAVTRHPIYTGLLGMLCSTMLLSGIGASLLYFLAGIVLVEVKIAAEEKLLTATFGAEYTAYKRRVPQLIPGLRWLAGALRRPLGAA